MTGFLSKICVLLTMLWGFSAAAETFRTMGTVAQLQITGCCSQQQYSEIVKKEFAAVCSIADLHDPQSELSRLNCQAAIKPFVCTPELYKLLQLAREAYLTSGGAFDISAKPLMDLWGFYRQNRQMPTTAEISRALELVGLNKVIFDDEQRSIFFTRRGMALDLGGNLLILNPASRSTTVGIRDPLGREDPADILQINSAAVSSSGGYEKFRIYNNKRYAHIMDPATGLPVENILAVTAISDSAARADWMSTAVFVGGEKLAAKLVKTYPGSGFYIYRPDSSGRSYTVTLIK